jgi:hypothetical protein
MGQGYIKTGRTMNIIKLPYKHHSKATMAAIEMSRWCQERDMVQGRDYDWAFQTQLNEIHFRFFNDQEQFASFFMLTWAGYEV